MNRTLPLLLTLICAAAAATPLSGQGWLDFGEVCSAGSMQTCASFQALSIAYDSDLDGLNDRTQLYFRVRNLHFIQNTDGTPVLGGSILAQFGVLSPDLAQPVYHENVLGFVGVAGGDAIFAEGDVEVVGSPADYWSENSSTSRLNKLGSDVEWALASGSDGSNDSNGGILSCLNPDRNIANMDAYYRTCASGGWVTFAITTQGSVDMSQLEVAWGVTSDSFTGESWQGSAVIPEPITLALLGSGLMGIGGAAMRRRRRNGVDFESD